MRRTIGGSFASKRRESRRILGLDIVALLSPVRADDTLAPRDDLGLFHPSYVHDSVCRLLNCSRVMQTGARVLVRVPDSVLFILTSE